MCMQLFQSKEGVYILASFSRIHEGLCKGSPNLHKNIRGKFRHGTKEILPGKIQGIINAILNHH
jgi:hypothetical protein